MQAFPWLGGGRTRCCLPCWVRGARLQTPSLQKEEELHRDQDPANAQTLQELGKLKSDFFGGGKQLKSS